jgi:CelD/BcsL family acetyltransferase involved in cellulose biosynthesis
VEIVEVADPNAIAAMRDDWNDLVDRSVNATIYQSWEWNDAWWKWFGRGKKLCLLLVREHGVLVGIAPFYVSRHLKLPLRRMAFLGTGPSDYLDIIVQVDKSDQITLAVLEHLMQSGYFDMADFQQLRPASPLLQHIDFLQHSHGFPGRSVVIPGEPCPYLPLPVHWEEYEDSLGKKMRSNLRYHERLLARSFSSVEITLTNEERLTADMEATFTLHQERWNARLLPGALRSRKIRDFHLDVARRFLSRGWLRLRTIRLDGRAVASLYCFLFGRRYYYYLGGFAPELARFSLGTILTARAIKDAIEEKCTEFDFLRGAEPYKYRWQPEERVNSRLLLVRPKSIRSSMLLGLNRLERAVEHRAKTFAASRGRRKAK